MIHHLYTLCNDYNNKFSYPMPPYKDNIILLTSIPMLYINYIPMTYLFNNYTSVPLHPFILFFIPWPLFPSGSHLSILRICDSVFVLFSFRFHIQVKSYVLVFLWLITLSIVPSWPIHVVTNSQMSFFLHLSSIPLIVMQNRNRLTDIENRLVIMQKRERHICGMGFTMYNIDKQQGCIV